MCCEKDLFIIVYLAKLAKSIARRLSERLPVERNRCCRLVVRPILPWSSSGSYDLFQLCSSSVEFVEYFPKLVMAGICSKAMTTALAILLILIIVMVTFSEGGAYSCPSNCRCTLDKSEGALSPTSGRKVLCQNANPPISNVSQFVVTSLPKNTVFL